MYQWKPDIPLEQESLKQVELNKWNLLSRLKLGYYTVTGIAQRKLSLVLMLKKKNRKIDFFLSVSLNSGQPEGSSPWQEINESSCIIFLSEEIFIAVEPFWRSGIYKKGTLKWSAKNTFCWCKPLKSMMLTSFLFSVMKWCAFNKKNVSTDI